MNVKSLGLLLFHHFLFRHFNKLNKCHGGRIPCAEMTFDDARISTRTVGKSWGNFSEQFVHCLLLANTAEYEPARRQITPLAQRDESFDKRTEILCLRLRGQDTLTMNQGGGKVAHERQPMLRRPVQFAFDFTMPHEIISPNRMEISALLLLFLDGQVNWQTPLIQLHIEGKPHLLQDILDFV